MDIINQPHDKFFKETFGDIEIARDFIINYLPPELVQIIDIDHLTIEKDSFIENELVELFSDLLFKTHIAGSECYIYFLFEHKSYQSPLTALQLLKYMIAIWELKTNKEKQKKLPIIIPLIVYHGESRWNIQTSLSSLIEGIEKIPGTLKKHIPDYEYITYDLSPYGAAEIKGGAILRIILETLKSVFKKDVQEFYRVLKRSIIAIEEIEQKEKGTEYFEVLIRYIMNARNDIGVTDIYELAKEVSLERSEEIMTIAEQLIQEGMEKGMEKGVEKGVEKGKMETARAALLKGADMKFVAEITGLPLERIQKLKKELKS